MCGRALAVGPGEETAFRRVGREMIWNAKKAKVFPAKGDVLCTENVSLL